MKTTRTKISQSGLKATKKVHSEKNHSVIYTLVAQATGGGVKLSCSCKGWIYQCQKKGTLCKHLKAYHDELELEIRGAIAVSQIGNDEDKMSVLGGL